MSSPRCTPQAMIQVSSRQPNQELQANKQTDTCVCVIDSQVLPTASAVSVVFFGDIH